MQTSDRNKLSQTVRFNSSTEIFWVFDKLDISYETTHHPPMFTVSDSKRLRESRDSDAYTKNLFLKKKMNLRSYAKICTKRAKDGRLKNH